MSIMPRLASALPSRAVRRHLSANGVEIVEEGMRAAEAIGDDTLQKQTQGTVVPDSFTHGSSAQRMEALRRGMTSGDPAACNYAR